jgi:hypothetical protein
LTTKRTGQEEQPQRTVYQKIEKEDKNQLTMIQWWERKRREKEYRFRRGQERKEKKPKRRIEQLIHAVSTDLPLPLQLTTDNWQLHMIQEVRCIKTESSSIIAALILIAVAQRLQSVFQHLLNSTLK